MDGQLGLFGEDGLVKNFTFERGFVVEGVGFGCERGKALKNTVAFEHELDDPLLIFAPDRHVVFLSTNSSNAADGILMERPILTVGSSPLAIRRRTDLMHKSSL